MRYWCQTVKSAYHPKQNVTLAGIPFLRTAARSLVISSDERLVRHRQIRRCK
jgi:hypothetical protein